MSKKQLRNKGLLAFLLVLSLGVFAFGLYGLWQFRPETTHKAPDPNIVATSSDIDPNEEDISPEAEYNVPAGHPRRIILPSIGAEGFVQQVGVDDKGNIAVPTNINLAGWFVDNPKPGDKGVSLIDGHVQGWHHPGIFKDLKNLEAGDTFEVEYGDYSKRRFEVVGVKSYSVSDVAEHMLAQAEGIENQLNLITCGGRFDPQADRYEDRVLVVSKRIDES